MKARERMKTTPEVVLRCSRPWILFFTAMWSVFLLLSYATVSAQELECYYCNAPCDSVIPEQVEKCPVECGTWYSSAGNIMELYRGCIEFAPEGVGIYQRCAENLCNDQNPVRCLRCDSIFDSECPEVVCPNTEDQCYLNAADGHRGCTSDVEYETDCSPGTGGDNRCTLCTATNARCNENLRCVFCDGSAGDLCLQDPAAVQSCPRSTEQCFRYLNAEQTLHMGCTSSQDYLSNCNQPRNCRTCSDIECNRDNVFGCYTCADCYTVDKDIFKPLECTIFETDRCYVGFDWQEKLTYRGCASQDLLPFDAADLCYESGCNVDDFPVHLQCYQCVGCDQPSPTDNSFCQSESATGCFMLLTEPEAGTRTLIRGCNTDAAYDDCREDRNCVTCEGDGCNGGPKQTPILCAHCTSLEECEQGGAITYSCADTTFFNRCYMFSDADGTFTKGCLLDLEPGSDVATACYDPDDSRCQYCAEGNCNRQHCFSCDTRADGLACILGLGGGTVRFEMCNGAAADCLVLVDGEGHTVRGCVEPLVDPCEATLNCELTPLPGSNGGLFPPDRRSCYRCDNDELCHEQQDETSEQYCPFHYGASDGCYVYNDGSTVVRGCTSDPDARCSTADDPACFVSSASLSNGEALFSCYQDCPGGGTAELIPSCPPVTCSAPNDRCFLSVSPTGVISRGCTTSAQRCPPDSRDCFVCAEPACNGAYAVCAACDTELDADCTVAEEHGDVCEGTTGCFHYVNVDREIYGCADSVPAICSDDSDHCQFCTEVFCNARAPAFCYFCTDCAQMAGASTKICPIDGDTCFAGIFGGSRVDRGCYSEMPEPIDQYEELQNCASPYLCNNVPWSGWTTCYVCTDCAGEPGVEASTVCPNPLSNGCYTVRTDDGTVERGCLFDPLPEDCVEGVNCAVCVGEDNCNGRPAGGTGTPESPAFSCVRCEGENCADYNVVSVCPNEKGLLFDGCVTYVDGTDVRKGCLSDEALWELCPEGGAADGRCTVWDEPNGNARTIRCFTCSGSTSECVREQLGPDSVDGVFEHGGCVVYIEADGTIVRDSSNEGRDCDTIGAERCEECFTDGCNGKLFPDDRLDCYQCSGEPCAQLSTVGSGIVSELCLRYDPTKARCYTRYDGEFYAERGCLSDDAVCPDPAGACELCDGGGCNDHGYDGGSPETLTCLSCGSNRECDTNPTVQTCSDRSVGCYTFSSGLFVIAKGCVSELDPSSAWYTDCTPAGGSERCQQCTGDNCNGNRCFVCTSYDEEGCFEPTIGGVVLSTACPNEECVAFIDDNGHLVRGCASDFTEQPASVCPPEGSETCLQCATDHCNGALMPQNRLKCYQCAGSAVECLVPANGYAKYCSTYGTDGVESCYTFFADENTVERGCVAERETECTGYCQRCSATECNDQRALVPNTLRCVECDSVEGCAEGANVPQTCPGDVLLGRTDRCYTIFDGPDGAVSERGCLSRLSGPDAIRCEDRTDASCKLCSPDSCNAASAECIVCDSETNSGCAGDVPPGSSERQCGSGRCVSLVKAGITWKGCAEDFEEDCTQEAESMCAIFEGDLSNRGVFPEDRLQCYQCRGGRNTCGQIGAPLSAQACQRYSTSDECYTYVADTGETIRGCLSDPTDSLQCIDDPAHCIRCESAGCNTAPSEQPSWLSCAKCSQAAECTVRERDPVYVPCGGMVLLGRHDSCYTYSFGEETLARGCLSEADAAIRARCPTEGECSVCHCDRCNGLPVTCAVCEGVEGCGDVLGPFVSLRTCVTGSCVAFGKPLFEASDALVIVKGCSEDYETDTCARGPPGDYQLCQSPGCNDVLYPPDRIRCFQCEGESCVDKSLQPTVCEPYVASSDACYSFLDRQRKGCVGQLGEQELRECLRGAEEENNCEVCSTGDGCNVEPRVQECTVCSSETDPSCADPERPNSLRKACATGGCATFIDANGFTIKDCAVDHQLTEALCAVKSDCFVCSTGDGCNDGVRFPSDRLECFQCTGSGCVDVTQQRPTVCRRYDPTDACYTYALGSNSVERGCVSDSPSCPGDACVTCSTPKTGCNTDPVLVPNEHSCYRCSGAECAQGQTGPGSACAGTILLGRTDACYAFVDTYTVRRGCLSEEGACDPSDPNCHVCGTENDCNGDGYQVTTHECIQCDEDADGEGCRWGFLPTEAVRCPEGTAVLGDGCYSCYDELATVPLFRRGCVGDASQQRCRKDGTLTVCLGTGCNNRNDRLQICAKCDDVGCDADNWIVEECRGTVPYDRRGCYLMLDSRKRILARGCVADLVEADWQRCVNARDGSCTTCLENQCNRAVATVGGGRIAGFAVVLTVLYYLARPFTV